MPSSLLMSMTDIAELAGVRRPVVTTWRRRHDTFPTAVDTRGPRPLFDGHAVCDWLVSTGRAERGTVTSDLCVHAISTLGSLLPPRELVAAITALICLRHLDDEPLAGADPDDLRDRADDVDPGDEMLYAEVSAAADVKQLPALVDELIEAAWGCEGAFDRIMTARARLGARELAEVAVAPELARMMAELSGAPRRAGNSASLVLADPAAGAGDLLAALIASIPESCTPVVQATEPDPYLARLLRRRFTVRSVPPEDLLVNGEPTEPADAVVTHLPFRPAEHRDPADAFAAIAAVRDMLARYRGAAILGPADLLTGPLPRFSQPERTRADLLASGVVTAVINLPGGLVPFRPGYQTALWVLTSGIPPRGRVLLADVSAWPLDGKVIDALTTDVDAWRGAGPGWPGPRLCQLADVATLVDSAGPLVEHRPPTVRERTTTVPATVARVAELERGLAEIAGGHRPTVRTGLTRAVPAPVKRVSIRALLRDGTLALVHGVRIASADIVDNGHHPAIGVPELAGQRPRGQRRVDRVVLAQRYPRARLTEPGDVLVSMSAEAVIEVDHDGFNVIEFPVRALRIRPRAAELLTPRLLAALLRAAAPKRGARAVRASRLLPDWEIPVLEPGLVREADRMLTQLDARRALAERELAALTELGLIAATGLTNGTLTVHPEQEM
ncbi:MAG TPA: hypothetical protein VF444_02850 [Pseudonocardiaceae bacterium]